MEDVHNLMDDVAEQHEVADELSDALSNAVGFSRDVSDVSVSIVCDLSLGIYEVFLLLSVFFSV